MAKSLDGYDKTEDVIVQRREYEPHPYNAHEVDLVWILPQCKTNKKPPGFPIIAPPLSKSTTHRPSHPSNPPIASGNQPNGSSSITPSCTCPSRVLGFASPPRQRL